MKKILAVCIVAALLITAALFAVSCGEKTPDPTAAPSVSVSPVPTSGWIVDPGTTTIGRVTPTPTH